MAIAIEGYGSVWNNGTVSVQCGTNDKRLGLCIVGEMTPSESDRTAPLWDGNSMSLLGSYHDSSVGYSLIYYYFGSGTGSKDCTYYKPTYSSSYCDAAATFVALSGCRQTVAQAFGTLCGSANSSQSVAMTDARVGDMIIGAGESWRVGHQPGYMYPVDTQIDGVGGSASDPSGAEGAMFTSYTIATGATDDLSYTNGNPGGSQYNAFGVPIRSMPETIGAVTPTGLIYLRAIWHHLFGGIIPTGFLTTTKYSYHFYGISGAAHPTGLLFYYKLKPITLYAPYVSTMLNVK